MNSSSVKKTKHTHTHTHTLTALILTQKKHQKHFSNKSSRFEFKSENGTMKTRYGEQRRREEAEIKDHAPLLSCAWSSISFPQQWWKKVRVELGLVKVLGLYGHCFCVGRVTKWVSGFWALNPLLGFFRGINGPLLYWAEFYCYHPFCSS